MKTIVASVLLFCAAGFVSCTTQSLPRLDAETGSDSGQDTGPDTDSQTDTAPPVDFTFFLLTDTHCNDPLSQDQIAMVRAVNELPGSMEWPGSIGGETTGFTGGTIDSPEGVVFSGDITGSGDVSLWNNELQSFQEAYETGNGPVSMNFPAYVGLGNHDLDREDLAANLYRQKMWEYVEARHKGDTAPVPVANFHGESRNYSWDWYGVHFVQTHKCATDTTWEQPSAMEWLADDLATHAGDGRPVVIVQHYGFDAFGTEDRWWTGDDRDALDMALDGTNVVAIFAGHSHYAMTYSWKGRAVFQGNNAKAEIDEGNNDDNGSFFAVRITNNTLEVVTCRWIDENGTVELIPPLAVVPINN